MNRRGFLKSSVAVAVGTVFPVPAPARAIACQCVLPPYHGRRRRATVFVDEPNVIHLTWIDRA